MTIIVRYSGQNKGKVAMLRLPTLERSVQLATRIGIAKDPYISTSIGETHSMPGEMAQGSMR
jgi:hypothetical protein